MKYRRNSLWLLACVCVSFSFAIETFAQTPPVTPPPAAANTNPIKAFKEVITAQAKSDEGLFTVHRIDEKLFFEIPTKLFGKEMLLVSRQAKTPQYGRRAKANRTRRCPLCSGAHRYCAALSMSRLEGVR